MLARGLLDQRCAADTPGLSATTGGLSRKPRINPADTSAAATTAIVIFRASDHSGLMLSTTTKVAAPARTPSSSEAADGITPG